MDQIIRFGNFPNNSPLPCHKEYRLQFIHCVRKFFDNISWRVISSKKHPESNDDEKKHLVPRHEELVPVQEALYDLVENVKFRKYNDAFQNKLKKDLDDIKNEPK